MDRMTGRLYSEDDVRRLQEQVAAENNPRYRQHLESILNRLQPIKLTPRQAWGGTVGRNEPCPCGSGNKFKKCCLNKGV